MKINDYPNHPVKPVAPSQAVYINHDRQPAVDFATMLRYAQQQKVLTKASKPQKRRDDQAEQQRVADHTQKLTTYNQSAALLAAYAQMNALLRERTRKDAKQQHTCNDEEPCLSR